MAAKEFEVGDVLPATTQLRIIADIPNAGWDNNGGAYTTNEYLRVYTYDDGGADYGFYVKVNGSYLNLSNYNLSKLVNNEWVSCEYVEYSIMSIIIDTSTWTETQRTIVNVSHSIYWEDLNAPQGYSITFEENGGSTVTDLTEQTNLPNPLPTPTKSNLVFGGWFYESTFTTKALANDTLSANVTLYAKWYDTSALLLRLDDIKTDIKTAINAKGGTLTTETLDQYASAVEALELGGGDAPSTGSQNIFTGATIPLTYKDNTHDYENNYEYKSATHNITITGLDGRATITGNGTKNVLVAFDVTSATSSLKNFTITCVNGEQTLEYKGLHAHYGTTVTGILTFAYLNITKDGSEGIIDTNYKFIVTDATTLPIFSSETTLWNSIYSYQVMNVLMGNYSSSSIESNFLRNCYSFNQPLTLPSNLSSIGDYFLGGCRSFNQPLTLPSNLSSIGSNFLGYCYSFNQPLTLPSNLSSIVDYFLRNCYSFNQPLTLPSNLSSIGNNFLGDCRSFNQPLTLPSNLSSIGNNFLYNCYSFNQPLTLPSSLTSIGNNFLGYCYSFNQPLTLPSSLSSIGSSFLYNCYSLSVIVYNASVYPTDNNSLSQDINSKTSSGSAGIIVYGTKRANLISALPNRTSSPYRKLINGGS